MMVRWTVGGCSPVRFTLWLVSSVTLLLASESLCAFDEPQPLNAEERTLALESLEPFNGLIGAWRGTAQPVRNSTRGAWAEKAEWIWEVKKESVGLNYVVKDGQAIRSAHLTYQPDQKSYLLRVTHADGTQRDYVGQRDGNKLIVTSPPDAGFVHRLTMTQLNEKRTLVLLEKRPEAAERFTRVVEVGYTREGTNLAVEGAGDVECIVSGGKGTIQVSHKGQTYWVCCTGCRDAFNEDPEGILAEAAQRLEKKKQKAAGQ